MAGAITTQQLLGLFAYDIADLIDRDPAYAAFFGGEVTQDTIERALPAFLAALGVPAGGQDSEPATADPEFKVHNCNTNKPGKPLPFGRKQPGCPRCDELLAGAPPRQAAPWIAERHREDEIAAERDRARQAHFAPNGPHQRGTCGPVCTAFDS